MQEESLLFIVKDADECSTRGIISLSVALNLLDVTRLQLDVATGGRLLGVDMRHVGVPSYLY